MVEREAKQVFARCASLIEHRSGSPDDITYHVLNGCSVEGFLALKVVVQQGLINLC